MDADDSKNFKQEPSSSGPTQHDAAEHTTLTKPKKSRAKKTRPPPMVSIDIIEEEEQGDGEPDIPEAPCPQNGGRSDLPRLGAINLEMASNSSMKSERSLQNSSENVVDSVVPEMTFLPKIKQLQEEVVSNTKKAKSLLETSLIMQSGHSLLCANSFTDTDSQLPPETKFARIVPHPAFRAMAPIRANSRIPCEMCREYSLGLGRGSWTTKTRIHSPCPATPLRLHIFFHDRPAQEFVDGVVDEKGRPLLPANRRHIMNGMVYNKASKSFAPPRPRSTKNNRHTFGPKASERATSRMSLPTRAPSRANRTSSVASNSGAVPSALKLPNAASWLNARRSGNPKKRFSIVAALVK